MVKILIDKRSIKRNKDSGSQVSSLYIGSEIKFSYYGPYIELPKGVYWSAIQEFSGNDVGIEGYIDRPVDSEWLKIKGLKIEEKINRQTVHHLPIPEYNYSYQNTKVRCVVCENKVGYKQIEFDGHETVCPICRGLDTFDYSFQKLEEVL
jgi:replication fork clamp-binding protein CrfC